MDKQLIERIALEVAKDYLKFKLGDRKWLDIYDLDLDDEDLKPLIAEIERECADSFMQFLTRIDAERGKEAVAWFLNSSPAGTAPFYEQVAKQYEGDTDTFPLFRSPTIPEGMVLVPVEPTDAMELAGLEASYNALLGCCTANHSRIYRAMLAAAQGERNAD